MRPLLTIAAKDALIVMRDKTALLIMLAMPIALIFILGSALGGLSNGTANIDAKVAIVNLYEGDTGQLFVDGLTGKEEVAALFDMELADDVGEARAGVENGDLTAALVIPADLTEKIAAGEPVSLEVLQDPGSQVTAGVWTSIVRAAVSSASAQIVAGRTLSELAAQTQGASSGATGTTGSTGATGTLDTLGATAPTAPTGAEPAAALPLNTITVRATDVVLQKQISTISYYAAGMTGMFLLFGSMFGAFAFIGERREQTLARMLATPASRFDVVGGKALGIFGLVVLQFLVLLAGTRFLFGIDWGTNVAGTIAVGVAEAFTAAGLAMTFSALGKTERAVGGIAPAFIMFFAATGGSMIPAEYLPSWLLPLQAISPVYWSVNAFLDVMRGAAFSAVLGPVAALIVIGAALFGFGLWRVKYE